MCECHDPNRYLEIGFVDITNTKNLRSGKFIHVRHNSQQFHILQDSLHTFWRLSCISIVNCSKCNVNLKIQICLHFWRGSFCGAVRVYIYLQLTLALLGGAILPPPLWFFPGGAKTAARSAAKFSGPLSTSILHMYAKFETKVYHRS